MKLLTFFFTCISFSAFTQTQITAPIVEEGKRLYRSEMASWYGTDLFIAKYTDQSNIGGYFSYMDKEIAKCIFFSRGDKPLVIGTISFDSTYNTATAKTDLTERNFSAFENEMYTIRKIAYDAIDKDTLFKTYKNTTLNLVPLIYGDKKKVYILTGTSNSGVVIFGNDYLLTFDTNNKIISKKALHQNLIPCYYGENEDTIPGVEGTVHNHLPETGEFITATDICTLMLYQKFTKWKKHNVVSEKYLSIWNCLTNSLLILPLNMSDKDRLTNKEPEKVATTAAFIKEHNVKLNTVTPPLGFKLYYNCDSLLFMKGKFGDTIKIWTPSMDEPQEIEEFTKTLKSEKYGSTIFAKEIFPDGRIMTEYYHQTEFIYRNDSLFEIINIAEFPSDKFAENFKAFYVDSIIDEATFNKRQQAMDKEFEKASKFVPKLIFAKSMFKGDKGKITLSKKVNVLEDEIVLERKWKQKGVECYTIRINNKEKSGTETSYSYSFDKNMRFVLWEGCD